MQTATASDLNFDNFVAFNSDNAAYVKEAFSDSLATLFPSCVHITCLAHIINLLGDAFKKSFHEVTTFVKNMNAIFLACWGSKRQDIQDSCVRGMPLKSNDAAQSDRNQATINKKKNFSIKKKLLVALVFFN